MKYERRSLRLCDLSLLPWDGGQEARITQPWSYYLAHPCAKRGRWFYFNFFEDNPVSRSADLCLRLKLRAESEKLCNFVSLILKPELTIAMVIAREGALDTSSSIYLQEMCMTMNAANEPIQGNNRKYCIYWVMEWNDIWYDRQMGFPALKPLQTFSHGSKLVKGRLIAVFELLQRPSWRIRFSSSRPKFGT